MMPKSNIATALVEFHKRVSNVRKDAQNPHFRSTYASLAAVLDTVRGPLCEVGLAVVQHPVSNNGSVGVRTCLWHAASGETSEETLLLPLEKPTPQSAGSALTYARRYALLAVLGLAAEDDDGEAAEPRPASPKAAPAPARAPAPASAPGQPSPSGPVVPFGKNAGKPLSELSDRQIDWYIAAMQKSLDDPDKERFKADNQTLLTALFAERDGRKGAQPDPEPDPEYGYEEPF